MVKKFWLPLVLAAILLSGCSLKTKTAMDELGRDGSFHYNNQDLGFGLALPSTFDHYQTQRKVGDGFIDLEFFVPTADTGYQQEVPGYGKVVEVRIYERAVWSEQAAQSQGFKRLADRGNKVYAVKYWARPPRDWQESWNQDVQSRITASFEFK